MGHYGVGTTCELCGANHPTRSSAMRCADHAFNFCAAHAPITITLAAITNDERLDLHDLAIDAWSLAFRDVVAFEQVPFSA